MGVSVRSGCDQLVVEVAFDPQNVLTIANPPGVIYFFKFYAKSF